MERGAGALRSVAVAALLLCTGACAAPAGGARAEAAETAERFFRALYSGDVAVVRGLASEEVAVSYPGFELLFDTPVLRGREAVEGLARRFSQRWTDTRLEVHEAVAEGDRVVLVWSFRGVPVDPDTGAEAGDERAWGGISLLRLDREGRVVVEVGEESAPGPAARLAEAAAGAE